jgi:hypothetical protein
MRRPDVPAEAFLSMPPSRAEQELMAERESLEAALARVPLLRRLGRPRVDRALSRRSGATLELVPLTVASMARDLLSD